MVIKRSDAAGEAEETRTLAREVGRRSVAQLEASQARIMAEAGPTARWILGALVLLNGGGIALTVGSAKDLYAPTVSPAMIFFIFGTALAMIAALVSAVSAQVMTRLIGAAGGHWTQVSITGEISDAALKSASTVRKQGLIWSGATLAVALLSLMLFLTGAMTLADGVGPPMQPAALSPAEAALANAAAANAALPVENAVPVANVAAQPAPVATPTATPAPVAQPQPAQRRAPPRRAQRQPVASPSAQPSVATPAAAAPPPSATP